MVHPPARDSRPAEREWWWVYDPRQSLRAAAALFFGVGGIAFTVLIAWLAGRTLHTSLEPHLGASFETLAVQLSDKLDRTIYERYRSLQFTASLAAMRSYATAPVERRRILAALQDSAPDFVWLGFADAQGRMVAATTPDEEGSSAAERPWFRGAREQPYAGNLRESRDLPPELLPAEDGENAPRIFELAVPVSDPDGRFAGVLAAQVRWSWTREARLSVLPEAARRERLGLTVYSNNGDVLLDSGGSGWTRPPDTPVIADRRKFRGHFIEPTTLGTTYLCGFIRSRGFREYRGLGWVTAVRQPVADAFAPVTAVRRLIVGWGLAFTVVGMIGAWLFAGRISRRLRSVGASAARIQSGDVLATLPSGRNEGELEQMCGALGRMVEDFRARLNRTSPPER